MMTDGDCEERKRLRIKIVEEIKGMEERKGDSERQNGRSCEQGGKREIECGSDVDGG